MLHNEDVNTRRQVFQSSDQIKLFFSNLAAIVVLAHLKEQISLGGGF